MTTAATKPDAKRPMGPWPDFQSCVDDMQEKHGYDEETARKVCGAIKAKVEDGANVPANRAEPPKPSRMAGQLGAVNQYDRSVPIVASTTNAVDGEAITSWDLDRFMKNPVVLWAHDLFALPLGTARDVAFDPAVGLTMTVGFAREAANPQAEQVYQGAIDGIVRAVSVGYNRIGPGRAELLEVSFVPVGADEDAGTPDLNPEAGDPTDEELAKIVSNAAAELARHRARKRRAIAEAAERTDKGDVDTVLRMDRGPIRLDRWEETPTGGRKIPARLSRTGVLVYTNADGTTRRELRLAEEIFKPESLATLEHAAVIDIAHHDGMVTPETYKKATLGHVSGVRRDGKYIAGTLVVNDADALEAIGSGARTETSCGYRCRLDMTPGVHEGEEYDCVQRDIVYNHVALCPPNRGRAGPEVGLRLDGSQPWAVAHLEEPEKETTNMAIKIRFDGREMEEGSKEHLDALERTHKAEAEKIRTDAKAELDKVVAEKAEIVKRADAAEAKADAYAKEVEQLKTDAKAKAADVEKEKEAAKAEESKRVLRRVRLMRMALRFFGDKGKGDDDEDMDEDKMDGMSDREIHLAVIRRTDKAFNADGRSDDYVLARFDAVCEIAKEDRGIVGAVRAARKATEAANLDANDDVIAAARKKRDEAAANAWKTPQQ